jgi:hypothetical protein
VTPRGCEIYIIIVPLFPYSYTSSGVVALTLNDYVRTVPSQIFVVLIDCLLFVTLQYLSL